MSPEARPPGYVVSLGTRASRPHRAEGPRLSMPAACASVHGWPRLRASGRSCD